jgi:hypothetical protein
MLLLHSLGPTRLPKETGAVCVLFQDKCLCGQGVSNACKWTLFECQTLKCELGCSEIRSV